jgi:hypothetical protein
MSAAIAENAQNFGGVESMNSESQLISYVSSMRHVIAQTGQDIADFGIAGLDMTTDLLTADMDTLKRWAQALASEGGKDDYYAKDAQASLRQANVLTYAKN